jgi:hypothetical protein
LAGLAVGTAVGATIGATSRGDFAGLAAAAFLLIAAISGTLLGVLFRAYPLPRSGWLAIPGALAGAVVAALVASPLFGNRFDVPLVGAYDPYDAVFLLAGALPGAILAALPSASAVTPRRSTGTRRTTSA